MALAFPDPSRSFDEVRNAVRFFGHDGMFEIRFLVEVAVPADGMSREARTSEAYCLAAFDAMRTSVHDVARKVYDHSHLDSYTPCTVDFW